MVSSWKHQVAEERGKRLEVRRLTGMLHTFPSGMLSSMAALNSLGAGVLCAFGLCQGDVSQKGKLHLLIFSTHSGPQVQVLDDLHVIYQAAAAPPQFIPLSGKELSLSTVVPGT